MSNDKINYKIFDFKTSYNNLLILIKKTHNKDKIAVACNLYSKLHRLEIGLKKQMEKIEVLLEDENNIDADHTDTESDYSDASIETTNSIEVKFE